MTRGHQPVLDERWLNDRSEFQQNFVHGLRNPVGLHIQYRLEWSDDADAQSADPPGHRVVGDWTADERHVGFPGVVHGGLVSAVLDDVMGRCAALRHRWVVTGRLEVRYRAPAPAGRPMRVCGWITRFQRRLITARAQLAHDGIDVVAEATGTYLPLTEQLEQRMVAHWPGFAAYLDGGS